MRPRHAVLVLAVMLLSISCAHYVAADTPSVVVAVVEPSAEDSKPGALGYSVTLGDKKLATTLEILNGLARPRGERLALLIHHDVPIGTLGTLVSMAGKAGYTGESISVFIFPAEKTSMMEIPGYRSVKFSTDPEILVEIFKESR